MQLLLTNGMMYSYVAYAAIGMAAQKTPFFCRLQAAAW
jgi:hypothetical protein